jgi:surface antigen
MTRTGRKALIFGIIVALYGMGASNTASAHSIHNKNFHHARATLTHAAYFHHATFYRHGRHYGGAHVLQCVAFAKQDAGIIIAGNARDWWYNAQGVYERGHAPEAGSVLSFSATGRMPLGHVAVVSDVLDSRTITIDQAHWAGRGVSRDMEVKDVSENNDWTAVRVQLARGGSYGSIYTTHGFIYARADSGHVIEATSYAPMPHLGRTPGARHAKPGLDLEVAEVPDLHAGLDLTMPSIASDAPDRGLQ